MINITSPIQYSESNLIEIKMDLTPSAKPHAQEATVSAEASRLEVARVYEIKEAEEQIHCACGMKVKWLLKSESQKDQENASLGEISCEMAVVASCSKNTGSAEELKTLLPTNALAFLWAKMRDVIEGLTAMSHIGRLSLPAINPMVLVEHSGKSDRQE